MSYEGYSQFLCPKGHTWNKDCYELPQEYEDDVNQKCPICGEEEVWENMVNITNGSYDEDDVRIDGFVELEVKSKNSGLCSSCGCEHVCEITYEIPGKSKRRF